MSSYQNYLLRNCQPEWGNNIISKLPSEIFIIIATHLALCDFLTLIKVCKYFYYILDKRPYVPCLWEHNERSEYLLIHPYNNIRYLVFYKVPLKGPVYDRFLFILNQDLNYAFSELIIMVRNLYYNYYYKNVYMCLSNKYANFDLQIQDNRVYITYNKNKHIKITTRFIELSNDNRLSRIKQIREFIKRIVVYKENQIYLNKDLAVRVYPDYKNSRTIKIKPTDTIKEFSEKISKKFYIFGVDFSIKYRSHALTSDQTVIEQIVKIAPNLLSWYDYIKIEVRYLLRGD